MITNYKGKDYYCRMLSSENILFSIQYVDDTFKYYNGIYLKYVDKYECTNTRFLWIFATYKGENIEIYKINLQTNQLLLTAGSSLPYSKEFIDVVLGGQEGRDLSAWCDINTFSSFYMLTEDEETKEECQISLDLAAVKEYFTIWALYKM